MLKRVILLFLLAFPRAVMAEAGEESVSTEIVTETVLEGEVEEFAESSTSEVINIHEQPCQQSTFSTFGGPIIWRVREGSADNWAQEITPMGFGTSLGTATLIDAPFDWNTGFRIGLGYQSVENDFDVSLYYTKYNTQASNTASGEVYSAFLGNFYVGNTDGAGFGPHYRKADIQWDFDFHTIDAEVGRKFTISDSLTLRPFVGVKAAVINQSMNSNWYSPVNTFTTTYLFGSASENLTHDFWGIGPSLGATATVPLYTRPNYAIWFIAAPSGSVMYGNWKFKDQYRNDGPTSTSTPTQTAVAIDTDSIDGAATMVRGLVGIEWRQYFARVTTTARVGYEAQVWLNQMQFYSFNMGRLNNLTSLEGCVLEFGIHY